MLGQDGEFFSNHDFNAHFFLFIFFVFVFSEKKQINFVLVRNGRETPLKLIQK